MPKNLQDNKYRSFSKNTNTKNTNKKKCVNTLFLLNYIELYNFVVNRIINVSACIQ